jgi:hypothetical protein
MPTKLVDLVISEVSAVDAPANKRKFLILKHRKEEDAMQTPEEIYDEIRANAEDLAIEKSQAHRPIIEQVEAYIKTDEGRMLYQKYIAALHGERAPVEPAEPQLSKIEKAQRAVLAKVNAKADVIVKREKLSQEDAIAKVFRAEPRLYEEYVAATQIAVGTRVG